MFSGDMKKTSGIKLVNPLSSKHKHPYTFCRLVFAFTNPFDLVQVRNLSYIFQ